MNKQKILISFLGIVGSLQMVGWIVSSKALMGIGFLINASPLPLVFSHFRGIEPFSAKYEIEWTVDSKTWEGAEINPRLYSQLSGPYNYRNVFGAIFAAGPVFQNNEKEKLLWETAMRRSFCGESLLAKSFGLPQTISHVRLIVHGRATGESEKDWIGEVPCE